MIEYPNLKVAIDMFINTYRLNVVILGDGLSLARFLSTNANWDPNIKW